MRASSRPQHRKIGNPAKDRLARGHRRAARIVQALTRAQRMCADMLRDGVVVVGSRDAAKAVSLSRITPTIIPES